MNHWIPYRFRLKKEYVFLLGFLVFTIRLNAQSFEFENIVPNPGFEELSSHPLGWFYKGSDYTRLMKYWNSPTHASPDVYHPKVRIPIFWTQKGFGIERPRTGQCMTGITVYGCKEGKPHCREYIQVQLLEPLVVGQTYQAEFHTMALSDSKMVDGLGMAFLDKPREEITTELLEGITPAYQEKSLITAKDGRWHKVSFEFKAGAPASYLVIGNFLSDDETRSSDAGAKLKYAYYYIDDVKVRKTKPIIDRPDPIPVDENDLCCVELAIGKTFELRNIFFESAKAELLPKSFEELNKLLRILQDNPSVVIEVQGHTDNRGGYKYNLKLSRERAQAVVDYLTRYGISKDRLYFKGFGDTRPLASNDTEEGRGLNRRVAFVVLRM